MTTSDLRAPASPSRRAARRGALATGVGGVGAVGLGALAAAFPIAVPALIALPVVLFFPLAAVALAVLADGVAFPLFIAGSAATLVNIGVLGAVLVALPAVLLRGRANTLVVRVTLALLVTSVTGLLIAVLVFPVSQVLSGTRYFVVPLAVAVLATTLDARKIRLLLRAVAVLMTISFAAAIVETALGSDRLLAITGLAYGTSIRNIGEALRAPGTFATNFHLGAYSSVVAVIALLWWGTLEGARKDLVWRGVALVSAIGCLALSTYRTGVVLLVVSVVAAIFLSGDAVKPWVKATVAFLGIGVAIAFIAVGLGNTNSLFQRFEVWAGLFDGPLALLGHGVGYAGAASGAAGAEKYVFTDNYYLSLLLQFGIPGAITIGIFFGVFAALFRQGRRGNRRAALAVCLWAGVLVAFLFVELWEYTSAMCLIALVVAASARGHLGSAPPSPTGSTS